VTAFEALHLMRVAMRGQFNDELLRGFIKLLGGWNALSGDDSGGDILNPDILNALKVAG
jgi:hypothetical protein